MTKRQIILKRSFKNYISNIFWYNVGRVINRCVVAYQLYKNKNSQIYSRVHGRLPPELIGEKNDYVNSEGYEYRNVHVANACPQDSSQYYLYKYTIGSSPAIVCNIGAFYCGADVEYLKSHKNSQVYALDFGDMEKLNRNINHERLFLYSGYPLQSLEKILNKKGEHYFDFVTFTRTAVLMNANELQEYMDIIRKLAKNVAFFEVIDTSTLNNRVLNYDAITIEEPIKMYSGMYIHNYIKLIEKFGFRCSNAKIVPPGSFPGESANGHHMICVVGTST